MNISERIKIKKAIIEALRSADALELTLTLQEFGLDISSVSDHHVAVEWCVYRALEPARDSLLLDLADHLGVRPKAGFSALPELPKFWVPNRFRIFLSHLSADKRDVSRLAAALARYEISTFVAHEDIEPTAEWAREIFAALDTMDAMAAFITSDFSKSKWTDQEVGIAQGQRTLVVPLRVGADPYGPLGRYQALAAKDKHAATVAAELFELLRKHPTTRDRMVDSLVALFENAVSYESAREAMTYLNDALLIEKSQLDRIRAAHEANRQIRECAFTREPVTAAEHINRLLKRHQYRGELLPTEESEDTPF